MAIGGVIMSISTSQLEERVITLERAVWNLPDLNARRVRLTAFEQQLAQSAMYTPAPSGPPPACNTIPGCPGTCLADTLYARDAVYGAITLTRDDTLHAVGTGTPTPGWTGCKTVSFAAWGASCFAASPVAVWYDLLDTGIFRMRWVYNGSTTAHCPIVSACTDTPNASSQSSNVVTITTCVPFAAHILVGNGFVPYGNSQPGGVRVDFADTPL